TNGRNVLACSVSNLQHWWQEWELQCLVLASFALQAFFLFAAGIRRRNMSPVLRLLLWLAYLSADYVAVFVLGHLSLEINDPRHQLVLLWAPVLLLHLGGQETITAFSMQDNELWKRHLLGLVTQVVLAVYVVAKSWRSNNGLLVGPVALMFISGTVKYAERTWALRTATPDTIKGSRMSDLYDTMRRYQDPARSAADVERYNKEIVGRRKWWLQEEYADLVEAAGDSFPNCINALMDIPVAPWLLPHIWDMIEEIVGPRVSGPPSPSTQQDQGAIKDDDVFPSRAYKMGEIQLSLMYDHLYTKVGLRYAQQLKPGVTLLGLPLLTLVTTSSALVLFAAVVRKDGGGVYITVDVAVSYVLLAGAVALELLSVLTFTLSFRSYCFLREKLGASSGFTKAVFWLVRATIPQAATSDWRGTPRSTTSPTTPRSSSATSWTTRGGCSSLATSGDRESWSCGGYSKQSDVYKSIDKVDFPTSVVMWHLITDMCFALTDGGNLGDRQRHMRLAREVSSYLMCLVMERRVMTSSEGHVAHRKARDEVKKILAKHNVRKMLEAGVPMIADPAEDGTAPEGVDVVFARDSYETIRPVLPRAWRLAQALLHGQQDTETGTGGGGGDHPWELIASVWIEMLFHLATRCEPGFHAKNLCTGGEFITHVRFLLLNRGIGWNFILGRA
ncbi:LOW QUALITY PROTEIN: hypothetical protein U9M48_000690, partial [Paspalum notatum var. saurae]